LTKIAIGGSDGHELKLDIDLLLSTRLLIQANSGGGKSFLLRRLAEQLYGKVQTIILDPEGEFFTLREKFGYVLVGQNGETPADERSAAMLAEKLLQLKASAICDLFEAFAKRPMERRKWVATFLESLLDLPRTLWRPLVVIVDEAQKFCPQETPKAGSQQDREIISRCKDAMISLSTTGRKRSFCAVWATQRLAKVDKDATAEFFNRLVGMTIEDVDVDRAADLMSVSKEDKHDFRNSLRTLRPGQFWAFGRAITTERRLVMVGPVTTRHPEAGLAARKTELPPAPDEVKALLPQLKDLPQAAEEKQKTEAEYKRQIRELRASLTNAQRAADVANVRPAAPAKDDPRAIERAVAAATKPLREQLRQIKAHAARAARSLPIVRSALEDIEKCIAEPAAIEAHVSAPLATLHPQPPRSMPAVPTRSVEPTANDNGELKGNEIRVLRALAQLRAIDKHAPAKEQIAAWAQYSPTSSTFTNPLGSLRSKGYIVYPQPGTAQLTDRGIEAAGPADPPTWPELKQRLLEICNGAERRILAALLDQRSALSKLELAERTKYSPTSSTFTNPLGSLRTKGLLGYPSPGWVRAADWLLEYAASEAA
jgi:uncharacterized protein